MNSPAAGLAASVQDVSMVFATKGESVVALDHVSLDLAAGEFICLIGPSGCGKSTLLNLIGGLLTPTGGTVSVYGHPVAGPPAEVGMMFQRPVLLDWRTVLSNVLLPIEILGGRGLAKQLTPKAMDLLDLVGLTGFEQRYPRELSGGMQQRAAICRMLISDPQLLLLDEPFGALDELTRENLNVQLDRIVEGVHKATVLVTHSIQEGVFLADRVIVMSARPGRIVASVPIDLPRPRTLEMLKGEQFLALANEVRGHLERGHDLVQAGE